jgi:hypothetical protein
MPSAPLSKGQGLRPGFRQIHLAEAGIESVLVGGAVIAVYSNGACLRGAFRVFE